MKLHYWLLPMLILPGCVGVTPARVEPNYRPTYPQMPKTLPAENGSLYQAEYAVSLFDDSRARRVGDVITIRLEEQTSSSKSAETTFKKDTTTSMAEPTVLGSLVRGVAANAGIASALSNKNDFTGEAESDQSNSLSGTVTATVSAVYPNGLLLVEGEKWLNLNRGEEFLRVSGLVRPEDVGPDNIVSSLRLADARIVYSGTGAFADTNSSGWLAKFFLSPLLPF